MQLGPVIFSQVPEDIAIPELNNVPNLLDLYEGRFFVHFFENCKTSNLIFKVPSEWARGDSELLMISYVLTEGEINVELSRSFLEKFVEDFQLIPEVYKGLYPLTDKIHPRESGKFEEIRKLLVQYYDEFPREILLLRPSTMKIFVFGLQAAGKTTILNFLKKEVKKEVTPTLNVNISRLFLENIAIWTYDAPGQTKLRELWDPHLQKQDGLVYVLDAADPGRFPLARDVLLKVLAKRDLQGVPLLVLLNKVDMLRPDVDDIKRALGLEHIEGRHVKWALTSGITGEGIEDAFKWLTLRVPDTIVPISRIDLSLIYAVWEEVTGVDFTVTYPAGVIEDPNLFAVRCMATGAFVFGEEKFTPTSFILPFLYLHAKVDIFFDYIPDTTVRGGRKPIVLGVFFNEEVPTLVIEQFTGFIMEKLASLKLHYDKQPFVSEKLKEIYEIVLLKIKPNDPVTRALQIAEVRYQTLFKSARDAIFIIDKQSLVIVDANEQASKLLQRPLEKIIGMSLKQIHSEKSYEKLHEYLTKLGDQQEVRPLETEIMASGGVKVPVEFTTGEIQIGGQTLIQCIMRDITVRKTLEAEIWQNEMKFRLAFENATDAIIWSDAKTGIIINCNKATEILLNAARAEILGQSLSSIFPNDIVETNTTLFRTIIQNQWIANKETRVLTKTGNVTPVHLTASVALIGKDMILQGIYRDISERKRIRPILTLE